MVDLVDNTVCSPDVRANDTGEEVDVRGRWYGALGDP